MAHEAIVERIGESVDQKSVLDLLGISHQQPISPPRPVRERKTRLCHRLHTPGKYEIDVAGPNCGRRVDYRHHSGRTDHIHGISIDLTRNTRFDCRLSWKKLAMPGAENISHDVKIQIAALNARPFDGCLHHVST